MPVPDVWRGVPGGPAVDGVTCRPRVRHRSVVLQRRELDGWRPARCPARAPGEDDAEWFLGWHRWRTAHGLPARVFATVHEEQAAEGDKEADAAAPGAWFGGSKPQYVDFDSPLSLLALEGLLAGGRARTVLRGDAAGRARTARHAPRAATTSLNSPWRLVPRPAPPGTHSHDDQKGPR